MTQDQINEWAREADMPDPFFFRTCITRFAALVAKHEREACALAADAEKIKEFGGESDRAYNMAVKHCARAIRARGEKP